jgi:hypothetical protein
METNGNSYICSKTDLHSLTIMFTYDVTTRMSRPSYTNLSIRTVNFLLHIMFVYNIYIDLVVLLERVDGSFGLVLLVLP